MSNNGKGLPEVLANHEADLLADWIKEQAAEATRRAGAIRESELRDQSKEFLSLLKTAVKDGSLDDLQAARWSGVRGMLNELSRSRGVQGFSPSETASFVFSLKKPLFDRLRREFAKDGQTPSPSPPGRPPHCSTSSGLYTTEVHQKSREEIITRQQQEMLELSTPVVKLWEGILALPMIGTLDSARTQVVMETLLQQDRRDGFEHRHHRHHGRADGRYPDGPALAENGDGGPADGGRVHHQRHPPADRPDDRPPRRGPWATSRPRPRWPTPSPSPWNGPAAPSGGAVWIVRSLPPWNDIPILRMGEFLLVTIQVDMHDRLVTTLQDDLTSKIADERRPRCADRHISAWTWSIRSSAG